MKTYLQVTTKYLKVQKKRTLLTVLGIIMSVALFTGIGTITESIRDKMVRDAEKESGSYHVVFKGVPGDKVRYLQKHTGVKESGRTQPAGDIPAGRIKEENGAHSSFNRYLRINAYDREAMNLLPLELSEGRLPEKPGELAAESWVLSFLPGKPGLGDKIILESGSILDKDGTFLEKDGFVPGEEQYQAGGQKEYTLVGIIKPALYYTGKNIAKGVTGLGKVDAPDQKYNVYVKFSDFRKASEKASAMAKDAGLVTGGSLPKNWETNERVLRLYGQSANKALGAIFTSLVAFVIVIVVLCMIAVIYNAFNISVLERVSQFGLLRCVGASSGQIRKIVLREALLLSLVGIPAGVFCGTVAIKFLFDIIGSINSELPFSDLLVVILPSIILQSMALGLATVLLSAWGPARQAAAVAPLDALRNIGGYRKESFKKIKKSRLAQLLFGVEGWIAWKNLRRNRKRFNITVFSMVVSIILYIVFNSIFNFVYKSEVIGDKKPSDYLVYKSDSNARITERELESIRSVEGIGSVTKYGVSDIKILVPEKHLNQRYRELSPEKMKNAVNGIVTIDNGILCSYGDEILEKLKKGMSAGKIDAEAMNREDGVIILNTTVLTEPVTDKTVFTPVTGYRPGDVMEFEIADTASSDGAGNGKGSTGGPRVKVRVAAVLNTSFFGSEYSMRGGLSLITTGELFEKMTGSKGASKLYIDLKTDADRDKVAKSFEKLKEDNPGLGYIDYSLMAENQLNTMTIMGIFIYGFIAVITLIGSINIINTISTNLILRTRELSMMKAVGMTRNAIKKMVCLESIYTGIIAAAAGGILGTVLSYWFYTRVIRVREFPWTIPWNSITAAGLGAVLIALLASFLPLRRINNGIIVENIRAEE